ncbi:MAG TPA: RHS repeat-associated core domain-containing protein, partial [Planctomycetota bacterium]|nr:RHS repeat-associated core domain-containing protein [Planctomycetota bacterium]
RVAAARSVPAERAPERGSPHLRPRSQAGRFLLHDPSLPDFLRDLGDALPSSKAIFIAAPAGTMLDPAARESEEIAFAHSDHLGSTSVTTDRDGALLEELAYFPFGELRHRHAESSSSASEYDFTGKETDDESGLVYHGARFYLPSMGRFLSVDPLYGDPASVDGDKLDQLISSPQRFSIYSYVLNNPLRYTDPNGLEERTRHPTMLLSKEEVRAWGGHPELELPMASESWSIPSRSGSWTRYESDALGSSNALPPARSGWQRVTVVLRVTGPDGKPVARQHVRVDFSRPAKGSNTWGSQGHSETWGMTDKKGFVTIRANVPARGGQISVLGFFKDKSGTVRPTVHVNDDDFRFRRRSGQKQLRFQVKLKSAREPITKRQGATVHLRQTK